MVRVAQSQLVSDCVHYGPARKGHKVWVCRATRTAMQKLKELLGDDRVLPEDRYYMTHGRAKM